MEFPVQCTGKLYKLTDTTSQDENGSSVVESDRLEESNCLEEDDSLEKSENEQNDSNVAEQVKPKKRNKIGFKDRKIIEYENRIRAFSTPDKIFRYFATLRIAHQEANHEHSMAIPSEVYMTPNDFLRSITPGAKQPEGYGLDQFKKYDPRVESSVVPQSLTDDSIFYKLGSSGLISFSDYIFLLTVLSASKRHFEIAFKMFDLNGDGEVDFYEFDKVQTIIRNQTSVGMRHRDHNNTGNTFKGVNSALTNYFFGANREKKLTVERFLEFQERLQIEILTLEFCRNQPNDDGLITEVEFGKLLLTYAGLPEKRRHRMLKRVKKKFKENSKGISLQDYLQFFHFLNNINDVDTALTFYHIAGASIDEVTLKHVAKTVAQVNMTDNVIDVVFTLFDENRMYKPAIFHLLFHFSASEFVTFLKHCIVEDGQLSNKEFISVMKNRLNRGLMSPHDALGLPRTNLSCVHCHTLTSGENCVILPNDTKEMPKRHCVGKENYCMVKRLSYYSNQEDKPKKLWALERNCSAKCVDGCVVIGERTKLFVCTTCCHDSNIEEKKYSRYTVQESYVVSVHLFKIADQSDPSADRLNVKRNSHFLDILRVTIFDNTYQMHFPCK
ncbi:Calcium uptake protein 1, mitochondrial [Nymphon striatum]|nr:Calcium uptake protein 1, mitochondrial [Nymphon striatum]